MTNAHLPPTSPPRIVSLLASATEIVYELGLGPFLVGRSHECDFPAGVEQLPCCTRTRFDCSGTSLEIDTLVKRSAEGALSVYEVLDGLLEQLQPTHIITQTQCEVCAVSLRDVELSIARRLRSQPRIVSLEPNALADIWKDFRRVADSTGVDAAPVSARLQARMHALREIAAQDTRKPRVACIEWLEPLMAAGNWVPELVEMANAVNLFGLAGKHSPWMTWKELVDADPEVIIVMPCGFSNARTLPEMSCITGRPEYPRLKAAREGQVYVADGNRYFNRPGPSVVESLRILVEILHPGGAGRTFSDDVYLRFR